MCRAVLCLVAQSCPSLWDPMDCSPPGSSVHGDSPGKNTGVGCHALLQGIFLTQGSNCHLLQPPSPALAGTFLPLAPPGKHFLANRRGQKCGKWGRFTFKKEWGKILFYFFNRGLRMVKLVGYVRSSGMRENWKWKGQPRAVGVMPWAEIRSGQGWWPWEWAW